MSSRCRSFAVALFVAGATVSCGAAPQAELRVCADPNNLPFSNQKLEGFENEIATLIAAELDAEVQYTWWAQRRGFVRNTLNEKRCDVILGVPTSFELALTTRPYYRSSYVFLSRSEDTLNIRSLDDPRLRELRIGVQVIGDDYASTPPLQALSNRGIVDNIVGYSVYGDYSEPNPPARIVDAVARGDVDVALVWGPLAGYFAQQQPVALEMRQIEPQIDVPFLPMVFDISMGVRRADTAWHRVLNEMIVDKRAEIDEILGRYGVPHVAAPGFAMEVP